MKQLKKITGLQSYFRKKLKRFEEYLTERSQKDLNEIIRETALVGTLASLLLLDPLFAAAFAITYFGTFKGGAE